MNPPTASASIKSTMDAPATQSSSSTSSSTSTTTTSAASSASASPAASKPVSKLSALAALAAQLPSTTTEEDTDSNQPNFAQDNSGFSTADYDVATVRPTRRIVTGPTITGRSNGRSRQPVATTNRTTSSVSSSDYHDEEIGGAKVTGPVSPSSGGGASSWFSAIKNVIPAAFIGGQAKPEKKKAIVITKDTPAAYSTPSTNSYASSEDTPRAFIFSDKSNLDEFIRDGGASKDDQSKLRPNQRRSNQPQSSSSAGVSPPSSSSGSGARSRSSSAVRSRMPPLAEESEDASSEDGSFGGDRDRDHNEHDHAATKSTSVSGASSTTSSRPESVSPLPRSSPTTTIAASSLESEEDDPLAKAQRRARSTSRGRTGKIERADENAEREDRHAPPLGIDDEDVGVIKLSAGDSSSKTESSHKKQHIPSAPKSSTKSTNQSIPSKPASSSSSSSSSQPQQIPSKPVTSPLSSPSTSDSLPPSTTAADSTTTPPKKSKDTSPASSSSDDSSSSSSSDDDEEASISSSHESHSQADTTSLNESSSSLDHSSADPLGLLSKPSPAKPTLTASQSGSGTGAGASTGAPRRRKKKSKTPRILPIASWSNMSLELVVRDALLTRRVGEALVHIKERLVKRAKADAEEAGSNAVVPTPKYHLINPVPLFRQIAGQLLFQSLSLDHTGTDVLSGSWVLSLMKQDSYIYLKRLLYEVAGSAGRPLRAKIIRHFTHLSPQQLAIIRSGHSHLTTSSSSSGASSGSNLFSHETLFEETLEYALWELEDAKRKERHEKELQNLRQRTGGKLSRDLMEKDREREREEEAISKAQRESYYETVLASFRTQDAGGAFFTPTACVIDTFLYELIRILEWAYPNPSYVTTFNRAASIAVARRELEAARERRLERSELDDNKRNYQRGRQRVFLMKHAPNEFTMVKNPSPDLLTKSSRSRRARPNDVRTGSSALAWDHTSPTSSSSTTQSKDSPAGARHRAVSSAIALTRSSSSPSAVVDPSTPSSASSSSTSAGGPIPVSRSISDEVSGGGLESDDAVLSTLSNSLATAAGSSLTIHPFLGSIESDKPSVTRMVGTVSTERHPDFLTSSSESDESSESDDDDKKRIRPPFRPSVSSTNSSTRPSISTSQRSSRTSATPSRPSVSNSSQSRASLASTTRSALASRSNRSISSKSTAASSSSSSDSSSDEDDYTDPTAIKWHSGEVTDLAPEVVGISLPLSTEDQGSGTPDTPPLTVGRNGQLRDGLMFRGHAHFAPLVLQVSESHPLDPSYKGEKEKRGDGQESDDDDGEECGSDEPDSDDPDSMLRHAQLEEAKRAQQESCVLCRQDHDVARSSCTHDGYLNLNLMSLSRWSLQEFYLCLLDKQAEFSVPTVHPQFSHTSRGTPIDFTVLVEQVSEWTVKRQIELAEANNTPVTMTYRARLSAEHLRQRILFTETRFLYLLTHNDWRRMVSFIDGLPLGTRTLPATLNPLGRIEVNSNNDSLYYEQLLQQLPIWLERYSSQATYFMRDLVATELSRHGIFLPSELPRLLTPNIDPATFAHAASQMNFLPIARKLARLGYLFRMPCNPDRMINPPTESKKVTQSSVQPLFYELKYAQTAADRILAGLDAVEAVASLADSEASLSANTALASLHELLPFRRLSPFHIWFLHWLHQNGSGTVPILSTYLSYYRLANFDSLKPLNKSMDKQHSIFHGWNGIELYLRQGDLYKAGLINCNTYLVHLGGIVGNVGKISASVGGIEPTPAAPKKSSKDTKSSSKEFESATSTLTRDLHPTISAPTTTTVPSKAKDPTHTTFMQSLFDRSLHLMALATLMYAPRHPDAIGQKRLLPNTRIISAHPLSQSQRVKLQRKTSAVSDSIPQGHLKRVKASEKTPNSSPSPQSSHLPSYIIQSPSSTLFFIRTRRRVGSSRQPNQVHFTHRHIDFKSTESLPIRWVTSSSGRLTGALFLQTSSVALLPRLSLQPIQPQIIPLQVLGDYLVRFQELSLALYSIPKRIRTRLIQREELTTGNIYSWRKDSTPDSETTGSLSSNDLAAAFEGFGSFMIRREFHDDISLFDMVADLVRAPNKRARLLEPKKSKLQEKDKRKSKPTGQPIAIKGADWLEGVASTHLDSTILSLFDNPSYNIELIPEHLQSGYAAPKVTDKESTEPVVSSSSAATAVISSPNPTPAKRDQLLLELTGMDEEGEDDLLGSSSPGDANEDEENDASLLVTGASKLPPAVTEEEKLDSDDTALLAMEPTETTVAVTKPKRDLFDVFPPFPARLPHFSHPSVRIYGDVHELTYDYFLRKAQPLRAFHVYLTSQGLGLTPEGQAIVLATGEHATNTFLHSKKEALFQAVLSLALRHLLDVRVKISCIVFLHLCGIKAHLLRTLVVAAYRIYRVWLRYNQTTNRAGGPISRANSHASLGSLGSIGSLGSGYELRIPAFHEDEDVAHAQAMVQESADSDDEELDLRIHEDVMERATSPRPRALSPGPSAAPANTNSTITSVTSEDAPVSPELQAAILAHIHHLLLPLVSVLASTVLVIPTQYHSAFKSLYDATMFLVGGHDSSRDEHELASGSAGDPALTTFDHFFEADSTMWVLVLRFQQAFHQPLTTFPHHLLCLAAQELNKNKVDRINLSDAFSVDTILTQAHSLDINVDELLRVMNQLTLSVESFDRDYSTAPGTNKDKMKHLTAESAHELNLIIPSTEHPSEQNWYSTFLHCLPTDLFYRLTKGTDGTHYLRPGSTLNSELYGSIMKSLSWARLLMGQQELSQAGSTNLFSAASGSYTTLAFLAQLSINYPDATDMSAFIPTPILKNLLSIIHHLQHLGDVDAILAASRSGTSWPSWSMDGKKDIKQAAATSNSDYKYQTGERLLQLCRLTGQPLLALLAFTSTASNKPSTAKKSSSPPTNQHLLNCVNVYLYLITTQSMERMKLAQLKLNQRELARKRSDRIKRLQSQQEPSYSRQTSTRLTHLSKIPTAISTTDGSFQAEELMDDDESKADVEESEVHTQTGHSRYHGESMVDLDEAIDDDLDEAETFHADAHGRTISAARKTSLAEPRNAPPISSSVPSLATNPLLVRYFQSGCMNASEFKYLLLDYLIHPVLPEPYPYTSLRPLLTQTLNLFTPQSPLLSFIRFAHSIGADSFAEGTKNLSTFVQGLTDQLNSEHQTGTTTNTLLNALDLFEISILLIQHLLGGRYHAELPEEVVDDEKAASDISATAPNTNTTLPYRPSTLPAPPSLLTSPFTPPLRLPTLTPTAFQQAQLLLVLKDSRYWSLFDLFNKEYLHDIKNLAQKTAFNDKDPSLEKIKEELFVTCAPLTKLYPSFLKLCRERLNSLLNVFDQALAPSIINKDGRKSSSLVTKSGVTHRIRGSVPFHLRDIHAGLRVTERSVQNLRNSLEKVFPTAGATTTPILHATEPIEEEKKQPVVVSAIPTAPTSSPTPAPHVIPHAKPQSSRFTCVPYQLYKQSADPVVAPKIVIATPTVITEEVQSAIERADKIEKQNQVAADEAAVLVAASAGPPPPTTATTSNKVTPAPARPPAIVETLEASLKEFQSSFLWQFTVERQSFWSEVHGTFLGAGMPREEKEFFTLRLVELKAQLSLAEKEDILRYINQAAAQQQEQERIAGINSKTATTVSNSSRMTDETFKTLMGGILKQAIVPPKLKTLVPIASSSSSLPTDPSASPISAIDVQSPSPSPEASSASFPLDTSLTPTSSASPLCLVHNSNCLFRQFVCPVTSFLPLMPMTPLPNFLLFVPAETISLDESALGDLEASQSLVSQVWPPAPPNAKDLKNKNSTSLVWCGCGYERTAPATLTTEPSWLPLSSTDIRYGIYLTGLHKISLGDFVVGRAFQPATGSGLGAPYNTSVARSLVSFFEQSGFKSRDLQLLDIASIVLHHASVNVRDPAPYPKLPRLGCMVLVKQNPTLQASVTDETPIPATKKVEGDKKSKFPSNLTLSPHVHRSLILDSLVSVTWFGRNVAAKLHLLSDLAELLQTSFDSLYLTSLEYDESTQRKKGLDQLLARILQACMLHRQRDRKKFAKKLETMKAEFFENQAAAALEDGEEDEAKTEPTAIDEAKDEVNKEEQPQGDPVFLWSSIERLERLKESVREIGRLHPYSEMFLRIVQCYELHAVDIADTIADVLLPYICQSLKECNPSAGFVVTTRPQVKEEPLMPTPSPPPPPVTVQPVVIPLNSDNILGDPYDTMEVIPGTADESPSASSSGGPGVLTADPSNLDQEDQVLETDADGNLQPKRKVTITVKKSLAAELKAKKLAKVRAREEEQKRQALKAHLAHLDSLAARRTALQVEALERKRLNETFEEEEAWWQLFMKNLLAGLGGVQRLTPSNDSQAGMTELAASLTLMAQTVVQANKSYPLELEVANLSSPMSTTTPASSSSTTPSRTSKPSPPPASASPQTNSYAYSQTEAVALAFAYKFAITSLATGQVEIVVNAVRARLPVWIRLAESGVTQPLEIILRCVLIYEYEALALLFEHAIGMKVIAATTSSSSSRAGLAFLSDLQRSLVPSASVHFQSHLSRWLQESWSIQGMVSLPTSTDLNVVGPLEERYVTCCRFFGLFRPLATHFLRQATTALGSETLDQLMTKWMEVRGNLPQPEQVEGITGEQQVNSASVASATSSPSSSSDELQPGRSKLSSEKLKLFHSIFAGLPHPSLQLSGYIQSALLSASQYLDYIECEQTQTEVELLLAFLESVMTDSSDSPSRSGS